jgi:hypothetical protein
MSAKLILKFVSENPLLPGVAFGALAAAFSSFIGAKKLRRISAGKLSAAGMAVTIAIGAALLGLMTVYCTSWFLFDHTESTVTCLSWLMASGQTVYHAVDAPQRYSILYGPMLFVLCGLPLKLLGPSVPLIKMVCGSYLLAAFVLSAFSLQQFRRRAALVGLVYILVAWGSFGDLMVWVRADSVLIFLSALALLGTVRGKSLLGCVICGVAAGVAVNVKAHAGIYFIPLFVIILKRDGMMRVLLACACAAVAVIAPFEFLPNVSAVNYLTWLQEGMHHKLVAFNFIMTLEFLIYFLAPLLAVWMLWGYRSDGWGKWVHKNGAMIGSLLGCLLATCFFASKGGAGPWHLLPFVTTIAYVLSSIVAEKEAMTSSSDEPLKSGALIAGVGLLVGFVFAGLFSTFVKDIRALQRISEYPSNQSVADLRSILANHPGATIGMAPGGDGDYQAVWFRTVLVLAGQPLVIDPTSCMDDEYAGLPWSAQAVRAVGGGVYEVWIVPKNAQPLTLHSYYQGASPVFPVEIRRAFESAYSRDQSSSRFASFDVWIRRNEQFKLQRAEISGSAVH